MATVTMSEKEARAQTGNLVEMSWDPITRIVGVQGIYAKDRFRQPARPRSVTAPRRSSEATASSHEGQGSATPTSSPSRICRHRGDRQSRPVQHLHAEQQLRCRAASLCRGGIVNLGEAAEYMLETRHFPGLAGGWRRFRCEQLVKETNPGVIDLAERTESPHADLHDWLDLRHPCGL